jgi:hypothetical protein
MAGEAEPVELIRRVCGWCRAVFGLCYRCFRGQRYCSHACRIEARLEQHRDDQAKYQATEKG